MVWKIVFRPLLFSLPAETAHHLAMTSFSAAVRVWPIGRWLHHRFHVDDARLAVECFGLRLPNPIGLAAGFDKDALWFPALSLLGFGMIEVGTVTAHPQLGNAPPRLFRLPSDRALINRMGMNNQGSAAVTEQLQRIGQRGWVFQQPAAQPNLLPDSEIPPATSTKQAERKLVLGVNIGKSKVTPLDRAVDDYCASFERLFRFASYVAINVSSPNTPGLRQLQDRGLLDELLAALAEANQSMAERLQLPRRPLLLKIAPDLTESQLDDVIEIALARGVGGLIATNTTVSREGLRTSPERVRRIGEGGLSGAPLATRSRRIVAHIYQRVGRRLPLVGLGGIMGGEDAWRMITAGASLVQVYTGLVYGGPGFVAQSLAHLTKRLDEVGLKSIGEAVGLDHK